MRRTKLVITALTLIIFSLSVVQVVASNNISTSGIELESLQTEVSTLKRENAILRVQVLDSLSLASVTKKATKMGFVPANAHVFVEAKVPLAIR